VLISAAPRERIIVDQIKRQMKRAPVDLSRAGSSLGRAQGNRRVRDDHHTLGPLMNPPNDNRRRRHNSPAIRPV